MITTFGRRLRYKSILKFTGIPNLIKLSSWRPASGEFLKNPVISYNFQNFSTNHSPVRVPLLFLKSGYVIMAVRWVVLMVATANALDNGIRVPPMVGHPTMSILEPEYQHFMCLCHSLAPLLGLELVVWFHQ